MATEYEIDVQRRKMLATMNGAYTGAGIDLRQVGTALYKNEDAGLYADVQVVADSDGEVALITFTKAGKTILEREVLASDWKGFLAANGFVRRAQTDSLA